jgi:lipoate-protein ligase A
MKFIDNRGITDPHINLALEEYALRSLPPDDDYLLFYINEPSIIIGKNQNTAEEINAGYVAANGIHVVRRLSGGGAVYHDLGNLSFSFITNDDGRSFHNFRKFTEPVAAALKEMGVQAEVTGRNDIQVGERKISGNAQYAAKGRMFSHGTLLFNSDLDRVQLALKVSAEKIRSKGIKSVRSRVANITEFLPEPMTIAEFRERLMRFLFGPSGVREYPLSDEDWSKIEELADRRYRSWDWNYGKSPAANFRNIRRFEGAGTLEVRFNLEKGRIRGAVFYGDFFGTRDAAELAGRFAGIPYDRGHVAEVLEEVDLTPYFGLVGKETFLDFLFDLSPLPAT